MLDGYRSGSDRGCDAVGTRIKIAARVQRQVKGAGGYGLRLRSGQAGTTKNDFKWDGGEHD